MSFRAWLFAVAIGLISGLVGAQEDVGQPEVQPEASETKPADEPADIPAPIAPPVAAPTDPPSAEHERDTASNSDKEPYQIPEIILGDGWAQWAMAFLALAGVGISAWAVWLLKRTLDATRIAIREGEKATAAAQDATKVAREVGEAQVRAYLHCHSATYHLSKGAMGTKIKIVNTGASPASHIEVSGELTVNDIGGFPSRPCVLSWLHSNTSTGVCYPIPLEVKQLPK